MTLTAAPESGSMFAGWSGACSGTGGCTVIMNADMSVTAKFDFVASPIASVSGTVSYAGTNDGRVYLRLTPSGFPGPFSGTSIAAPGPFTIRGVRPDLYTLETYMDHRNPESGVRNASNPSGSVVVNVFSPGVTGVNVILVDPPAPGTPVPPIETPGVIAFDRGALVVWEPVKNANDIEIPEFYNVYWATTSAVRVTEVPIE